MRIAFIGLIALLAASSVSPAAAGAKEDVVAADKAFSALSVEQGSNAAFLAYLADDGRLFGTGNEAPIIGKAEAIKRFSDPNTGNGDPKMNVLSWVPDHVDVSADGTLAWTDGKWTFNGGPDAKGNPVHLTGHYMTVWKKDAAGAWKVTGDMGTSDPTPQ